MSVTYPVVPALPYAVHPFTQNMIQQQAILEQLMRSSGLNNGITSVSTRNKAEVLCWVRVELTQKDKEETGGFVWQQPLEGYKDIPKSWAILFR